MAKGSSKRSRAKIADFQESLRAKFEELRRRALAGGIPHEVILTCVDKELSRVKFTVRKRKFFLTLWFKCCVIFVAVALSFKGLENLKDVPCLVETGGIIMEITRPISDCKFCNVDGFFESESMTKETFLELGYSDRPIIIRGAARHWKAMQTFSYEFFKSVYANSSTAIKTNDEYCQFFQYKSEFKSLEEFFGMPDSRADTKGRGANTWYVGWSNCDHEVAKILREHYSRPDFLPEDSEASIIDWIFMGYSGNGATVHLDYVMRPSWQAQISGRKSWRLIPPPECEDVCPSMSITVNPGDIIMINTNKWYHGTWVEPGAISITIGSEYD